MTNWKLRQKGKRELNRMNAPVIKAAEEIVGDLFYNELTAAPEYRLVRVARVIAELDNMRLEQATLIKAMSVKGGKKK